MCSACPGSVLWIMRDEVEVGAGVVGAPGMQPREDQCEKAGRRSVTPCSRNMYLVANSDFLIIFFDLLPVFFLYYELFI